MKKFYFEDLTKEMQADYPMIEAGYIAKQVNTAPKDEEPILQDRVLFKAALAKFGVVILRNESDDYDPTFSILGGFLDDRGVDHYLNASVKMLRNLPGVSLSIVDEDGDHYVYGDDHKRAGQPMDLEDIPFEERDSGAMVLDGSVAVEVAREDAKVGIMGIYGVNEDEVETFNFFLQLVNAQKVSSATAAASRSFLFPGKEKVSTKSLGKGRKTTSTK